MLDEEAQDVSSTKEEEERTGCTGWSIKAYELKEDDQQHLHSGGMLSLKSASFLYTFLDFFPFTWTF